MDAANLANPDSFSIVNVFLHADWVVKLDLVVLGLASVWSWAIIIEKLLRFSALNGQAHRIEQKVAAGGSLEDIATQAGDNPRQVMGKMLGAAMRDWRESRLTGPLDDGQRSMLLQRVDRGLDGLIARESARVEEGLSSLAIVATASPFIGLFGTVWGIMHAFQAIALQKNTSLAVVAPSIAEALFTTAVGLAAAIPAYVAYNKFSTDASRYTGRLEGFADDLVTAIQRRVAERL